VQSLPLSEQYVCRTPKLTAKQCIAILRRMAEAEPERVITRNYFRVHSGIPERTWRHIFGSFDEMKRAAGVMISRQVRRLELQISKHRSVDHYRDMTREAAGWGEAYLRPSKKRNQLLLVAGDFHDKECDPFALRVFLDTARRAKPDTVVIAGDLFDEAEFSRHTNDLRSWDPISRIHVVHRQILAPLREAVPDAQIDLIAGNHDLWVLRHLADETPALLSILSDLHGWTLADLLGLRKYEVNFISRCDLAAWTQRQQREELRRNFKVYNDTLLVSHFTKDALRKGMPAISAHNHKHLCWSLESPTFGAYEVHQLGCMCARDATYTDGERWSTGFALAHVDTAAKRTAIEYVTVGETMEVVGGKYYFREKGEAGTVGVAAAMAMAAGRQAGAGVGGATG